MFEQTSKPVTELIKDFLANGSEALSHIQKSRVDSFSNEYQEIWTYYQLVYRDNNQHQEFVQKIEHMYNGMNDPKKLKSVLVGFPKSVTLPPWENKKPAPKLAQVLRSRRRFIEHFLGRKTTSRNLFNMGIKASALDKMQIADDLGISNADGMAGACFEMGLIDATFRTNDKNFYAINADGTDVDGFPVTIGEKMKRGVALADFNDNGKVDIVVGTDSDNIYLVYDDGTIADGFPFEGDGDFRSEPTILDFEEQKIILTATKDGTFYAIDEAGELIFSIETSDDIMVSPSIFVYVTNFIN